MAVSSGYLITGGGKSLKIDPATGALTAAGSAAAGKGAFVWVAADSSNTYFCADDGFYAYTFANGSFSPVPGSPFYKNDSNDPAQQFACMGLAINPVYIMSSDQGLHLGTVRTIKRLPGGALASAASVRGINRGGPVVAHPNDKFFYVADDPEVLAFSIDANGQEQNVAMPSLFIGGHPPLAIDPAGKYLFLTEGPRVHAYAINSATGALSEVAGSPFASGGNGGSGIAVDPTGQFVLVVNGQFYVSAATNTVSVLSVNSATGALSLGGAPYAVGSGAGSIVIAHF